jgi:hypothetical protein
MERRQCHHLAISPNRLTKQAWVRRLTGGAFFLSFIFFVVVVVVVVLGVGTL